MTAPPLQQTGRERHIAAVHMNEKFRLSIKVYYSPTNAQVIVLKNNIKIYIKIAPSCVCVALFENRLLSNSATHTYTSERDISNTCSHITTDLIIHR